MSNRILLIRSCGPDGDAAHNGFKWPLVVGAEVVAPDWNPAPVCGGGLHGLPWGQGDWWLTSDDSDARWLVFSADPADVVAIDGQKSKARAARVEYVAPSSGRTGRSEAASWLAGQPGAQQPVPYAIVAAGDYGTATAGYRGTATAGDSGTATAGYDGTATAGYDGTATAGDRGTATAGDHGTATAGDRGTATAGYCGTATAGYDGTATAGDRGTATAGDRGTATAGDGGELRLRWWDGRRYRCAVFYVGEDGIKPGVAYRCEGGKAVRAEKQS